MESFSFRLTLYKNVITALFRVPRAKTNQKMVLHLGYLLQGVAECPSVLYFVMSITSHINSVVIHFFSLILPIINTKASPTHCYSFHQRKQIKTKTIETIKENFKTNWMQQTGDGITRAYITHGQRGKLCPNLITTASSTMSSTTRLPNQTLIYPWYTRCGIEIFGILLTFHIW